MSTIVGLGAALFVIWTALGYIRLPLVLLGALAVYLCR
jgi:hypothetical protein